MQNLSHSQKYSVDEITKELNLSTKLKNGIRQNFGDPISINDLKQINRRTFMACKKFGIKSWYQFHTSMSGFYVSENAVTLINKPNINNIIVEIDISKSFGEVIQDLGRLLQRNV